MKSIFMEQNFVKRLVLLKGIFVKGPILLNGFLLSGPKQAPYFAWVDP